uniref:C-SKI_SMAD_bind domain-containing protein n=1 Tax=Trichuris muris TaxID=70415 RepID=A0A5S6Q9C1_TRIMR
MIKNETGRLVQLLKRFHGGQAASLDPVTAAASSMTVNDSNEDGSLTARAISDRLTSCHHQEQSPRSLADDALLMDLYRVQRVFPVKPTPVLVPRDSGLPLQCEQTLFEGEWIACFVIGGEKRLCLTQFMHSRSLRRFSFSDINKTCAYLNIHCPPCSREQMDALKLLNVLPVTFTNSALITKTDAVRLYGFLCLQSKALLLEKRKADVSTSLEGLSGKNGAHSFIPVEHDCFGGCRGRFYRHLYNKPTAECVECDHCGELLSAKAFVSHSHCNFERHVCHWGFDSDNWPSYVHLPLEQQGNTLHAYAMEQLKSLVEETDEQNTLKRRSTGIPQESSQKRFRQGTLGMDPEAMRNSVDSLVAMAPSLYYDTVLLKAYASALITNQNLMRSHEDDWGIFAKGEHTAARSGPSAFTGNCLAVRNGVLPNRSADACENGRESVTTEVFSKESVNGQSKSLKRKHCSYSEERSNSVNSSEQCSVSSAKPPKDKDSLESLLKRYVSDPVGIRKISAKLFECLNEAETRLRCLEIQNRVLLEELFQIESRKQLPNGGLLPMAMLFNKAYL